MRLKHRNVVSVLDFGAESNTYYMAMEYVHGVSLDRLLEAPARQHRPAHIAIGNRTQQAPGGIDYQHDLHRLLVDDLDRSVDRGVRRHAQ